MSKPRSWPVPSPEEPLADYFHRCLNAYRGAPTDLAAIVGVTRQRLSVLQEEGRAPTPGVLVRFGYAFGLLPTLGEVQAALRRLGLAAEVSAGIALHPEVKAQIADQLSELSVTSDTSPDQESQ